VGCTSDKVVQQFNTPPSVTLVSPADGTAYDEGTTVTFEAIVSDDQDADEELLVRWSGEPHGEFTGSLGVIGGVARLETANLEGGLNHTVTVLVVDSGSEAASASVTVTVNDVPDAPEVQVIRPLDDEEIIEGADYEFVVRVADANTPPGEIAVQMRSDIDGIFCEPALDGLGEGRCRETLSAGQHLLTYSATDSDGFVSEGTVYFRVRAKDADADGFDSVDQGGTDCDDDNASIFPGAAEVCDGLDQDCDTVIDEDTVCTDDDEDGYSENEGDCDDGNPATYPRAPELEDGEDNNCDGVADEGTNAYDDDGDGYSERDGDCNDGEPAINPAAVEVCDSVDNNCNASTDEENAVGCGTFYWDYDGDGFGTASISACLCSASSYYTSTYSNDCYDYNAGANPGVTGWQISHRGDGSWDYNCDSNQEKLYTARGSCSGAVWICTHTDGWSSSVASCGALTAWVTGCSGFSCGEDRENRQQYCR
jgi:hypothetical protein